ncbi:MAG: alpha/beta hydrolase [Deltaproteobacteria bacterium]|nr:alpha/beta hydrolase [Deltaproteobacteria bacterium]MBW2413126.1 alpha/beta hydrolase [Deltaproteobacteria bacterium]
MGWLYLLLSALGAAFTVNVWRPNASHPVLSTVSWLAGWLTGELALHAIAFQVVVTGVFAVFGAFEDGAGRLGLAVSVASWAGLGVAYIRGERAGVAVERALREGFGSAGAGPRAAHDWNRLALPIPKVPPGVQVQRGLQFARVRGSNLRLDLYRPASSDTSERSPLLLQIHGGGWIMGDRRTQALPLLHTLAARGWACASVDYRLSPAATFPDHLVDVKRALVWLRQQADTYALDPDFVVVTGGSAGGHLASLFALTANDPEYQPGFESADTAVQGCISFYGVYDLADRAGDWPHDGVRRLLEERVMKDAVEEDPDAYERGSPLARAGAHAPPFFVIHGDADTLVPIGQARRFVERLREVSDEPVLWAEIPGAQHAFECFWSARTHRVVDAAARFADELARRRAVEATPAPALRGSVAL